MMHDKYYIKQDTCYNGFNYMHLCSSFKFKIKPQSSDKVDTHVVVCTAKT